MLPVVHQDVTKAIPQGRCAVLLAAQGMNINAGVRAGHACTAVRAGQPVPGLNPSHMTCKCPRVHVLSQVPPGNPPGTPRPQ